MANILNLKNSMSLIAICHPLEYFYLAVCAFEPPRGHWMVIPIQNAGPICGNGTLHFYQR